MLTRGNLSPNLRSRKMRLKDMRKCTSGVYIIKGERGIRVGQSICAETRVHKVACQFEACIGKTKQVYAIPVVYRKARLRLEKAIIEIFRPKCNSMKA